MCTHIRTYCWQYVVYSQVLCSITFHINLHKFMEDLLLNAQLFVDTAMDKREILQIRISYLCHIP